MTLRRFLALVALFAAIVSVVEPVYGEVRDLAIHHDGGPAASLHSTHAGGDYSQEGGGAPVQPPASDHHHATGADHCTHQHGLGIPTHADFVLSFSLICEPAPEPLYHTGRISTHSFHPPRA